MPCAASWYHVGSLRGLGYSIGPMIVSLIGACGLRVVWIFTIFQMYRTPENLYISYPISWIVTGAVHILFFLYARKKAFALVRADSRKETEGGAPCDRGAVSLKRSGCGGQLGRRSLFCCAYWEKSYHMLEPQKNLLPDFSFP